MTEAAIRLAVLGDIPAVIKLMGEYYAHDQLHFVEAVVRSALRELLGCETLGWAGSFARALCP